MNAIIKTPFKEQSIMQGMVRVLTDMVGDYMGKLITPNGTETTHPAIYLTSQAKFPQATLPLLQVSYEQINDEDGRLLDKGLLEVADPVKEGEILNLPYTSTHMYYTVMLTCQGRGSANILEKIRGLLRFDSWRNKIHSEMNSGIFMQTRISRNPQLISTEWRDQHTMLMTFSTVSTHIDYSGVWFNVIETLGEWANIDKNDPQPIKNNPNLVSVPTILFDGEMIWDASFELWRFANYQLSVDLKLD